MLLSSTLDSVFDLLTVLFIFVFVLALTYFATRYIANYQRGKSVGRNIEVLESYRVTSNKYLQIVRTGRKYLVIGIGKDEIHVLAELSEEELTLPSEKEETDMLSFKELLDKAKHMKDKKRNEE